MSFGSDFGDLCPDTVAVQLFTSRDEYGAPQYGTATSYKGRIVHRQRYVRQADGAQVLSSSFIRLPYISGLTAQSRITLPDGSHPNILFVQSAPDETGARYYSLVFFQ